MRNGRELKMTGPDNFSGGPCLFHKVAGKRFGVRHEHVPLNFTVDTLGIADITLTIVDTGLKSGNPHEIVTKLEARL